MKTKRLRALICAVLAAMMTLPALSCAKEEAEPVPAGQAETTAAEEQKTDDEENPAEEAQDAPAGAETEPETARDTDLHDERVTPPESGMLEVEKNMFLAKVGDCGFSAFLAGGGASSDADVVAFLTAHLSVPGLDFAQIGAGCSTVATQSADGGHVFGRNFDWSSAQVLMLEAHPSDGYASFSTVNLDFLRESARLPDEAIPMAAYYAPLDGMNEKGLAVSVNMISDTARIAQSTDKPDLESYDLHGSYDMMIHFAVADLTGRAVDVEYVGQEMVVIETPILTNFYLAEGEKHGIGSEESHRRFDALEAFMAEHETADIYDVRDALMTARESAFDPDPSEGTEWSVLYDQTNLTATWYRREKFDAGWTVELGK